MDFGLFKNAVAKQFERMQKHKLFRTSVSKDDLWNTYLSSFPEGTNPIYKERTEHDCNCCKSFIRNAGNCVAIIDGKVVSIWDVVVGDPSYQVVADALSAAVKAQPIASTFLHYERTAGVDKTFQDMMDGMKTWRHFFINIPAANFKSGADIPTIQGKERGDHDVLLRGLQEITADALDTALDLIAQNTLYRGAEHKEELKTFRKLLKQFNALPDDAARDVFVWAKITEIHGGLSRLRNTSMGTLLIDISEGTDLEAAVRAYEVKVAPTNYRRTTVIASKAQIASDRKRIEELGYTSAVQRRYANIDDITISNVLFANRAVKNRILGDVFDELLEASPVNKKALSQVESVTIDKFLTDILPRATGLELLVENGHVSNFVSLVAPVDATANNMFKWPNKISWSYNGDVADSVKERVKAQGGSVEGFARVSLSWFNYDDLDLRVIEPASRGRGHQPYTIYFGNRNTKSPGGGQLDVDMNCGGGQSREAVENIIYSDGSNMPEGVYTVEVNNYNKRESVGVGFTIDLELDGVVTQYHYPHAVDNRDTIQAVKFSYSRKDGFKVLEAIGESGKARQAPGREVWGVTTGTFVPVTAVMLSPNCWDGQEFGHKHYFFTLNGCVNDGQARGFFNEFLKDELTPLRRTLEMVANKLKTDEATDQLSGLGFSSTKRNSVICRVTGSFSRTIKITF